MMKDHNYLIFQPVFNFFKFLVVLLIKFATPAKSNNSFTQELAYIHTFKIALWFVENCLKQGKLCFTHRKVVNVFIVYDWTFGHVT